MQARWWLFDWLVGTAQPQSPDLHRRLLQTVVDRKGPLAVACTTVLATAVTAMWITDAVWPYVWALADLLLTFIRMRAIFGAHRSGSVDVINVPAMVVVGVTWAVVFGIGSYLCLGSGEMVLAVMGGMNVAGIAAATSTRLAAIPRYANLVITISSLPFILAAGLLGGEMIALLFLSPFWTVAITALTLQNHQLLRRVVETDMANRRAALSDRLTGLPNRLFLEEELSAMCARLEWGEQFAILSLDLDGFKPVNDQHGHAAGDLLLQAVAGRLKATVRTHDSVCRLGGDEFVVLLPGSGEETAADVAKRIVHALQRPFDIGISQPISIGASVGSVAAPRHGAAPGQLLAAADQALYSAKRQGRGRHRSYSDQARRGLNLLHR